jgi:hypothetical protein
MAQKRKATENFDRIRVSPMNVVIRPGMREWMPPLEGRRCIPAHASLGIIAAHRSGEAS